MGRAVLDISVEMMLLPVVVFVYLHLQLLLLLVIIMGVIVLKMISVVAGIVQKLIVLLDHQIQLILQFLHAEK